MAGNFAGHLEQAGEAADFSDVAAATDAPKGVFPFYIPGSDGFLGVVPISDSVLQLPVSDEPLNVQIEPEAGLLCAVEYDGERVARLRPQALGAFNDCSIRRPAARKISEKKNWGAASTGFASQLFELSEIDRDGAAAELRLACFLRRDGVAHAYGIDSPLATYSYFGEQLLEWIVNRLNEQIDDGPLEAVGEQLDGADHLLIGLGATRYTEFGERNYLQPGDESIVIVYDGSLNDARAVGLAVADGTERTLEAASVLVQRVKTRG